MKRIAATLLLALALPAAALADPPQRITIVSVFDPITFGENAFVNGQLVAEDESTQANQLVTLQEAPFPFGTWADVAQTTTDYQGYYSFKRVPSLTTRYRTVWNGQVTSEKEVQVQVAPRITLKAVPAGRATLRYGGTFAPAIDGQRVALQRQARDGSWTTIASPALHGGKTFGGRMHARSPAILRAFYATDGAHLDGYSRAVRAVPKGKARGSTARESAGDPRAGASSCRAPRIDRFSLKPSPPVARKGATLRVRTSLPGGRIYAIDVRWGEGDKRDHFTLAPSLRRSSYTFALRHRWQKAGRYRLTIRTYGIHDGCKRASDPRRPVVRVVAAA